MTKFEERLAAVLLEQDEKEKEKAQKLEKMQQEAVQAKREAEKLIRKSKIVRGDATDEEDMVEFLTKSLVATYYIHNNPKWKKRLLELVVAEQQGFYATKIKKASSDVNDIKKALESSIKEGLIEESLGSSLFKAGSVIGAFLCMIGVIKCSDDQSWGGRSKDKSGKSLDPIMQRCNCAMVDILCSQ